MSIARAEQLKKDLTDRFVVVADGIAELRRFSGLTGTVKTVNMNGRALVQFDNPVDISWYDIDPSYLHVVDAPLKKEKPAAHAAPAAPAKAAPKAAAPAGQSPLDAIRAKAAGGAAAAPTGEKKASPLDMIRAGGAKKEAAPAAPAPAAATSTSAPSPPEPPVQAPPAAAEAAAPAPAPAKPKSTADILASIRKKS